MNLPTSFDELWLSQGEHVWRGEGMCAMEAAAWIAGERHSDHPMCVDSRIVETVIGLNDVLDDDDRQHYVKPLIPLCLDTACDMSDDEMWAVADRAYTVTESAGMEYPDNTVAVIRAMCEAARRYLDRESTITVPEDFTVLDGADA